MAESYRGLTIRIGGDTTKLTQALKAANGAASQTQAELRKVGQALRLDPSSVNAFNMQLGFMSDKASETAMKLTQLRQAASDVANQQVKMAFGDDAETRSVQELAAETQNAAMAAAQANTRYNTIIDSLGRMHNAVTDYVNEAAKIKKAEIAEAFGSDEFKTAVFSGSDGFKKLLDMYRELPSAIRPSEEAIESFSKKLDKLSDSYVHAFESGDSDQIEKIQQKFERLRDSFVDSSVPKFNFDNGNVDLETLRATLESIAPTIGLSQTKIEAFLDRAGALKDAFKDAKTELERAKIVQQFEDLNVEILKTEAMIANVNRAMAEMKGPSTAAREVYDLTAAIEVLEDGYKRLTSTAQSMGEIIKTDPNNIDALKVALASIVDAERNVGEEAAAVREKIANWDSEELRKFTDTTVTAEQQLVKASAASVEANDEFERMSGRVSAARNELIKLENGVDGSTTELRDLGSELAEATKKYESLKLSPETSDEDLKQAKDAVDSLTSEMEEMERQSQANAERMAELREFISSNEPALEGLRQRAEEADKALDMAKQRKELEELNPQLLEVEGRMSKIEEAARKLGETFASASNADFLKGILGTSDDDINAMDANLKASVTDAIAFGNASKAMADNTELAERASQALAKAMRAGEQEVDALREKMAKLGDAGIDESVVTRVIDTYGSAGEAVRQTEDAVKDLVSQLVKAGEAGDDTSELVAELQRATAAANEAAGVQRWEQYQAKIASVISTVSGMQKSLRDTTNVVLDDSFSKQMADMLEQVKNVGFKDTGIDEMLTDVKAMGESTKQNAENFNSMKQAVKGLSRDSEPFKAALEAGRTYAASLKREIEEGKKALDAWDTSKLDMDAVKSGSTTGNLTKAIDEYKAAKKAVEELEKKARDAKKAVNEAPKGTDTTALKQQLDKADKELDEAKQKARELGDTLETALNTNAYHELQVDISVKEGALESVERAIDSGKLEAPKVDEAAFQQVYERISQTAQRAGREIVESSNAIDSAYRDMRKTVQGTEEQFEHLRDSAVEFSQTNIVTADTMLEMEALGGQLGIAAKNLQEFGETASNLDIATDLDAEDIALKMGQLTNVMSDLDETKFDNFADALVRLGNNTATTESAIMNVAQRMSSVANVTSMSTPQLLAWSAAIASTGQRSEAAATAVNNTITGIGKAVSKGGDTLEQFATIAGMSADKFREAWANSSSEALEAFIKGLAKLSDDSTSAIEALDSVGISSVRQETAILGLSQTIQNLDNAIVMSDDAFNGVSDQWGQAGDAAREAQRKSEGFSGTLAMLQNNTTALGASLGDGLIPMMSALSSALQLITGFMNSLPEPVRQAAVETGAFALAVSSVAIALRGLGFKDIIPRLLEWVSGIGSATVATEGMAASTENAAVATKGLGAAMEAVPGMVMIAAIAEVVKMLMEFVEVASMANDTTAKFNEAMTSLDEATGKISESGNATKTFTDLAESAHEGLEAINKFANESARSMSSVAQNSAVVREYGEDIKELAARWSEIGGDGADKESAFNSVAEAVGRFNEETGAAIDTTSLLEGEYGTLTSVIDEVTAAYERQSQVKAYSELYEDAVRQEIEAQEKLRAVKEEQGKSTSALVDSVNSLTDGTFDQTDALNLLASGYTMVRDAKDKFKSDAEISNLERETRIITEQKNGYKELLNSVTNASGTFSTFETAMTSAGYKVSELSQLSDAQRQQLLEVENALRNNGHTLGEWRDLNVSDLAQIASAWNKSVPDIISSIEQISKSTDTISTLEKLSHTASQSMTGASTEEVNKQKKLDTAAYNARKKTLDQEYKDRQKAYDADYKARQKELDKIYKAEQKASQNYLKQFKEQQSEEVEAFKEATDAKLKEIEREYEAKKELLELEYEKYDKDIDDRIQAIKDEQDAEDEAVKQRERREKLEELGKAVETAKTKKKREEAEKALSDYKDQLAREDTKKQRDAQIQALQDQKTALKEQLSERQEELKKSYDEAVSSYKAAREEELKILQKQHEIAYESENEFQTERLESIKEAHSAELESMKETQQAELELIKERNDQELSDMKEKQEEYIEAMKNGTAKAMANINNALEETASKIPQVGELIKAGLVNISEDGVISFTDEFKKMPGVTDEVMQLITDKIREAIPDVEITAEGIAKAVEKPTKDAANQIEQSVTGSFQKIADAMRKSKDIDLPTYINAINGLPTAIEEVFNKSGLSVQNGLDEVARRMLESGKISLSQYLDIMNGMPGSTRAICNETGVAIAEELGLFNEQTGTAASNLKKSVTSQFESMPREVKGKSDEAGNAVSSLGGQDAVDSAAKNSGSLYEAVMGRWSNVGTDGKNVGMQFPLSMASGASSRADSPIKAVASIAESVIKTVESGNKGMKTSGWNQIINYANGMTKAGTEAVKAAMTIAGNIASYFHHSTPDKGPLRDDDKWGGEMVQNFIDSMMLMAPRLESEASNVAGAVESGFTPTMGSDVIGQLIESMRSQESRLLEQSRRMADIVERGFDPKLTVDAAYEAIGKIDAGEMRKQKLIAGSQSVDNSTYAPVLNFTINATVREEADIDRLSQQIAIRVQRSINARIG